jgi:hypothetical protein
MMSWRASERTVEGNNMTDETDTTDNAPGWHAIDAALRPIYGDREPYHVGNVVPYALGGPDPIHGISAYKNTEPRPHWHFVTYGFTDLWAKESSDPDVSGFGFELTFRLTCPARAKVPPNWARNFLQNLGRYVFETGNTFGGGHTMPLHGPIEQGSSTLLHAASFITDPQLPRVATPNGRVDFLQVVGLTMDELRAVSSWNAVAFLELRRRDDPFLLTDLKRSSWLADPMFAAKVARRTKRDGSSCGWLALVLECDTRSKPVKLCVQTIAVDSLRRRLLGRLPYGRELTLCDKNARVVFKPGKRSGLRLVEDAVLITLQDAHVAELAKSLQPHTGLYPVPGVKNAQVQVLRTEITDRHGKVVDVVE